jgi:sulfur-oxidizing protein SoxB
VAEGARGEPVWEVVETWMKSKKRIAAKAPEQPRLIGVQGNPGLI